MAVSSNLVTPGPTLNSPGTQLESIRALAEIDLSQIDNVITVPAEK